MKKNFAVLGMIALVALAAGCKKESNPTELPVTIEQYNGGDKVYIDNSNYACWNNNDKVQVNGVEATITSTATDNAKITLGGGTTGPDYYAVYPAKRVVSYNATAHKYQVALPATQEYRVDASGNQMIDGLMAAKGTAKLAFKNLTALVKVTVPAGTTVEYIELSASNCNLSGQGIVSFAGDGTPSFGGIITSTNGTNGYSRGFVRLNCNGASRADGVYYVVVPAITNTALTVTVKARTGSDYAGYQYKRVSKQQSANSNSLAANQMGTINLSSVSITETSIPGTVVDLGLSALWATCNLGAKLEQYWGNYYAWGNTTNYYSGTNATSTVNFGSVSTPSSSGTLNNTQDAAYQYSNGKDRTLHVPSRAETTELGGCAWAYEGTSGSGADGVYRGCRITSNKAGYTDHRIFLPAGAHYEGTTRNTNINKWGQYWLNEASGSSSAYSLGTNQSGVHEQSTHLKQWGQNIRPVCR